MLQLNLTEIYEIDTFRHRKTDPKIAKAQTSMATFRRLIAPADAITLRCNHSTSHVPSSRGTRARSERPPAGPEKYTEVRGNDMSKQHFRFLSFSKNAIFATEISKISSHGKACLDSNSSLESKPQALILAEEQAMIHLSSLIPRDFHFRR